MWPFTNSNSEDEPCDHEWTDYSHEVTYPDVFYSEDEDPVIYRESRSGQRCQKCGEVEVSDETKERITLAVESRETIDDS